MTILSALCRTVHVIRVPFVALRVEFLYAPHPLANFPVSKPKIFCQYEVLSVPFAHDVHLEPSADLTIALLEYTPRLSVSFEILFQHEARFAVCVVVRFNVCVSVQAQRLATFPIDGNTVVIAGRLRSGHALSYIDVRMLVQGEVPYQRYGYQFEQDW